jgi:hypothetical protein
MTRPRILGLLGASVFAAAMVGTLALPAGAGSATRPTATGAGRVGPAAETSPQDILYDQRENDSGVGIVSQNFQDQGYKVYSSAGADEFVIPAGETWLIQTVDVTGVYFNGTGPAYSERVRFYADSGGLPGAPIVTVRNIQGSDTGGSFSISLGSEGPVLGAGTYWVSVQANMAFGNGGEWGWETSLTQHGAAAAWENPRNGFGLCPQWANMQSCIGPSGEGPDFMFALEGAKQ